MTTLHLPNIEVLIDEGDITVGVLEPVGCVAAASDGHNALTMLRRRDGESLVGLLVRLDTAIGKAFDEEVYTDVLLSLQLKGA